MAASDPLAQQALAAFRAAYSAEAEVVAAAPGRVNLIGEHTDYNDGFVLPMAIDRRTVLAARRQSDSVARIRAEGFEGEAVIDLTQPIARGMPDWSNYVRGTLAFSLEAGLDVPGFDAVIVSDVPTGAGLSSSAALEVATATLAEALAGRQLDPVQKALLCQRAEHEFAGMPCGLMDQFISAMGQEGHALLIDCRTHVTRQVALDDEDLAVLIIDSRVKHALVDGAYAQRRAACEKAAEALGVRALRDAGLAVLQAHRDRLDEITFRRARHVITENDRTLRAADLAQSHDWTGFGRLMLESHASMRDDFKITTAELDRLVDLLMSLGGSNAYGSRMTGGGFGGCTVSLVRSDAANDLAGEVAAAYQQAFGVEPRWFVTTPSAGGRVI
ncbi:MAG: galactokinase [Phycisphaeraceae bacterium]